jgi:hypothetical protein
MSEMTNFSNLFASGPFARGLSDIYEVEGIVVFGQIYMLIDRLIKKARARRDELLSMEEAAKRRGEYWSRDSGTLLWELDRITESLDFLTENTEGRTAVQTALALKLQERQLPADGSQNDWPWHDPAVSALRQAVSDVRRDTEIIASWRSWHLGKEHAQTKIARAWAATAAAYDKIIFPAIERVTSPPRYERIDLPHFELPPSWQWVPRTTSPK